MLIHQTCRQITKNNLITTTKIPARLLDSKNRNYQFAHAHDQT
jgi:hypothetical protein